MSPSRGADGGFAEPFCLSLSSTSSNGVAEEAGVALLVEMTVEDGRAGSAEVARGVEAMFTSAVQQSVMKQTSQ